MAPHLLRSSRSITRTALTIAALSLAGCSAGQVLYEPVSTTATIGEPTATLYLLGDGGAVTPGSERVMAHAGERIARSAEGGVPVVVAFLGDNIYEEGARAEFAVEDRAKLEAQIAPLPRRENVRTVFVPGNHDWGHGGSDREGRAALALQRSWLADLSGGRDVTLLPEAACPGPARVDVVPGLVLLLIDTEWLLRDLEDGCGSAAGFYERLRRELEASKDSRVVVLAHHPTVSGGPHGGNQSLFGGLPTISYVISKTGVALQDLRSPRYREMIERLERTFSESGAPPLVYAAGHEHNLQVVRAPGAAPGYRLVSGSVAKRSRTARIEGTRFAASEHGYMRLTFGSSGVRLEVFGDRAGTKEVGPLFACALLAADGGAECAEAPLAERAR